MREFFRMRTWAGPLTIGSFAVVGATGVLMFFHLNTGLMKLAHEWLGWLMVVGVVAHVAINWRPFVNYFRKPAGIVIIAVLFVLGALSAFAGGGRSGSQHPLMGPFTALEQSSLAVVAQVAKSSPEALLESLRARGMRVRDGEQTIREIASENGVRSMELLGYILGGQQTSSGGHPRG
jgi:hypothetical protein